MDQLRILRDATTDPEVRSDLQDEMNCIAMSLHICEMIGEEEETVHTPAQG